MVDRLLTVSFLNGQNQVNKNQNQLSRIQEKVSSGSNVSNPSYEPTKAGLAHKMTAHINAIKAAGKNIVDAQSVLQIADGTLRDNVEIIHILRELALSASRDALTESDRKSYNTNFQSQIDQLNRNASTKWRKQELFTGGNSTASIVSVPSSNVIISTGMALGTIDNNSIGVTFTGSTANVSLTVGGKLFTGQAHQSDSLITLVNPLDSHSTLIIDHVDLSSGNDVLAQASLRKVINSNVILPSNYMNPSSAKSLITNIIPDADIMPGQYYLDYKTDGENAIFTWENDQSKSVTKIPITDLVKKNNSFSSDFSGTISLVDGTELTLKNVDLLMKNATKTFTGALVNVQIGDNLPMSVQIGPSSKDTLDIVFSNMTASELKLDMYDLNSLWDAQNALDAIDEALDKVLDELGYVGGLQNQLDQTLKNMQTSELNQRRVRSETADVDMVEGISDFQTIMDSLQLSLASLKKTYNTSAMEMNAITELQRISYG